MVGFAVVAQYFNPSDQNVQTMRTMCKSHDCKAVFWLLTAPQL